MTGLLILLTALCIVLAVWSSALTVLYHAQNTALEAFQKTAQESLEKCKHIDESLETIKEKPEATQKELEDFKQFMLDEFDQYKTEISNEKRIAVQLKEDASEVMKAYRASINAAASMQRIVTKADGTRVIEAVDSQPIEIQEEKEHGEKTGTDSE